VIVIFAVWNNEPFWTLFLLEVLQLKYIATHFDLVVLVWVTVLLCLLVWVVSLLFLVHGSFWIP